METAHNTINNNQRPNIQNIPVSSQTIYRECGDAVYVCVEETRRLRVAHQYHHQNGNQYERGNDEYVRINSPLRIQRNCDFYEEEPIDLTCTEKREYDDVPGSSLQTIPQMYLSKLQPVRQIEVNENNEFVIKQENAEMLKRRGRKKKYPIDSNGHIVQEIQLPRLESGVLKTISNVDLFQISGTGQTEVLKAAKSLFLKRTRTLFHWMYPEAPKAQLKAAVASSWETLGEQEKELYISQVLGRFGIPQTNAMVNPQLGGLQGMPHLPPMDLTGANQEGHEETSNAVSSILMSENGTVANTSWSHSGNMVAHRPIYTHRISRKRGRLGRPPGSKNRKHVLKKEFPMVHQIREDYVADEFQDDPELNQEFRQFRWTLHLNDNNKT